MWLTPAEELAPKGPAEGYAPWPLRMVAGQSVEALVLKPRVGLVRVRMADEVPASLVLAVVPPKMA